MRRSNDVVRAALAARLRRRPRRTCAAATARRACSSRTSNEGRDGYDTIEWAAAQPWSTGEIGTFGLSYPGAVQWLAAVESPPHLKAMVPAMTFSTPRNFFYAGGTWDLSWIAWIWDNIAPDARVRAKLPGPQHRQGGRRGLEGAASRSCRTGCR